MRKNKEKGFTLIELLVVIAIIAILSTVVMAGLNSARTKSRDTKRVSDIKTLTKALELYFDTCGGYPMLGAGAFVDVDATDSVAGALRISTQDGTCSTSGETFGTFMAALPTNPAPGGTAFQYCSTADGAALGAASCDDTLGESFQLTFTLEGDTGSLLGGVLLTATPGGIQ